jgi:peptide/nickel transport system ATP-binding protein
LKSELGLSCLFITHDINVIKYMSNSLGILYYGKLVEVGPTYEVVTNPKHPYTIKLMANVPKLTKVERKAEAFAEQGPSTTGCIYGKLCTQVFDKCVVVPPILEVGRERFAACHLYATDKVASEQKVASTSAATL